MCDARTAAEVVEAIEILREWDAAIDSADIVTPLTDLGFKPGDISGQAIALGTIDAPIHGRIATDIEFGVSFNNGAPVSVMIPGRQMNGQDGEPNGSIDDLVDDFNEALATVGLDVVLKAGRVDQRIRLYTIAPTQNPSITLTVPESNALIDQIMVQLISVG